MARLAVLAVGVALALVAVGGTATAGTGGRPLSTPMTGAEEVPGPGDANASGQADLRLNQGRERLCFDLTWADIDGTVFAAHVHAGDAGVAGPIVVPLFEGTFGSTDATSGCVHVEKSLVKAIRKDPTAYYVNVHSLPDFPAGAIRGQLGD